MVLAFSAVNGNCTRLPLNTGQTTHPSESTLLYYISWQAGTPIAGGIAVFHQFHTAVRGPTTLYLKTYCPIPIRGPEERADWLQCKVVWIFSIQRTLELLEIFLGETCFRWLNFAFSLDPVHCSTKLSVWAGVALYFSKLRLCWSVITVGNRSTIDIYFIWPHFKKHELSL